MQSILKRLASLPLVPARLPSLDDNAHNASRELTSTASPTTDFFPSIALILIYAMLLRGAHHLLLRRHKLSYGLVSPSTTSLYATTTPTIYATLNIFGIPSTSF